MRVGVFGFGAVGTFLAARLSRVCRVVAFPRPTLGEASVSQVSIRVTELDGRETESGVLETVSGSWEAAKRRIDLAVLAVKHKDVYTVSQSLADLYRLGLFSGKPVVVVMQNGLGNTDLVKKAFEDCEELTVVQGVTYFGALRSEDKLAVRHTGDGKIVLSSSTDPHVQHLVSTLCRNLTETGVPTVTADNVSSILWTKLLVNSIINPLTALYNVPNGRICEVGEFAPIVNKAIAEFVPIAHCALGDEKLDLGGLTPKEYVYSVAKATSSNFSSMLLDIHNGRETEIGAINGAIVEVAKQHGLAEPTTHKLLHDLVVAKSACISRSNSQ